MSDELLFGLSLQLVWRVFRSPREVVSFRVEESLRDQSRDQAGHDNDRHQDRILALVKRFRVRLLARAPLTASERLSELHDVSFDGSDCRYVDIGFVIKPLVL